MSIKIKGVIGLDVDGVEFAERISKLSGDITFEIDSPGGSVFHGISIFNAIKNYNKGKCTMHVVGDCSSMAAYIMLAGDGPVQFEPNAIVVLHNPWSVTIGDYRIMKKESKILEEMAEIYAREFVKKGLFKKAEIRQIMDEETWFMGKNLKKLGIVNSDTSEEYEESSETESDEIKIAALREKISEAKAKLKAVKSDDTDKIAALIEADCECNRNEAKNETAVNESVEDNNLPKERKGENNMVKDLNELKAQNFAVYSEAKTDGVSEERKRVASLMKFIDINKNAVIKAISDGVDVSDNEFQSSILLAQTSKAQIQAMTEENAHEINPQSEVHESETSSSSTSSDEEEKLAIILEKMGLQK